jgi:pimeloyl-ACP methyl ester carboxylesterase
MPTGVAVFPGDSAIRLFADRANTIVHWSEFDRGGHYPALQAPDLYVQDVRDFFRALRSRRYWPQNRHGWHHDP